jgi:hypothetical protein
VNRLALVSLTLGTLGCDAFRDQGTLAAAARITNAAGRCLQAILTAERNACYASSDRESCLEGVETRFVSLEKDMLRVREESCDAGGVAEVVFAGQCEP